MSQSIPSRAESRGNVREYPRLPRFEADKARTRGLEIAELLSQRLDALPMDNNNRKNALLEQLASIKMQGGTPETLIAFYGATGAGKSSLINAILGDNLMFTSGMQACTSVVTEISYKAGERLEASFEFLTQQEWEDEVQVLLADIRDPDGRETTQEVEAARSKVKAVYPSVTPEELLHVTAVQLIARDSAVKMLLGNTANIEAADSTALTEELLRYIDYRGRMVTQSGPPGTVAPLAASMYWPLVKRVRIRVNCALLACGAILIDLPGIGDSNAARNSITQNYLRRADRVFIVAPIARVVSERTTNVLCSEAFRSQLEMDGKYNPDAVTFVVTKCDQIVYTETVRELHGAMEQDPHVQEINARKEKAIKDAATWKETLRRLETRQRDLESRIQNAREPVDIVPMRSHDRIDLGVLDCMQESLRETHLQEQGQTNKRQLDCDTDDAPPSKKQKPEVCVTIRGVDPAELETELTAVMREFLSARTQLDVAERKRQMAIKELKVVGAKKRSEYSKEQLKALFRASLDEMEVCGLVEDQPLSDHRDVELPVFTVSAHDYMRISHKPIPLLYRHGRTDVPTQGSSTMAIEDGEAACFLTEEDTGIPELQAWIQTMTLSAREAGAEKLLRQLKDFAQTVQKWIDGIPGVSPADREALRERWQSTHSAAAQSSEYAGEADRTFRRLRFGRVALRDVKGADISRAKRNARYDARPRAIIPSLIKSFDPIVDDIVKDLGRYFSHSLKNRCQHSATAAAKDLVKVSEAFVRVGDGSIKTLMHWSKYRATLRRKGDYLENLNDALAAPFIKRIARVWAEVFRTKLLATLQGKVETEVVRLLDKICASVPQYMKLRAEESLSFVLITALEAVRDVQADVQKVLTDNQKIIGRLLGPFVRDHLSEGYELAYAEKGKGMYQRQRDVFNKYLESKKLTLFDNAANALVAGLADATKAVGGVLDICLEQLAKKIEADVSVLWDVCPLEGEEHMKARLSTKSMLTDVVKEVDVLLSAKKARDDASRVESALRAQQPQRSSNTQPIQAEVASSSQTAASEVA